MQNILSLAQHYALPFILVISVVVFAHEFGHYWVARRCGIRVLSFSIGFGTPLFGWTDKHGTRWQVALLPFGGYVKMFGDSDPASTPDASVKTMTEEEKKVSFFHQPVNKRLAVVAAGPVANYIFAILVLTVLFVFQGQPFSPPVVGGLQENGVAAQAGLQLGDKFISIDNEHVNRFEDIKRIIALSTGTPVTAVIERKGEKQIVIMTPEVTSQTDRFGDKHLMGKIGIISDKLDYKKWSPIQAVQHAAIETWDMSASTLRGVGQMIMGTRGADEIGGWVGLGQDRVANGARLAEQVALAVADVQLQHVDHLALGLDLLDHQLDAVAPGGRTNGLVHEFDRGEGLHDQRHGARVTARHLEQVLH